MACPAWVNSKRQAGEDNYGVEWEELMACINRKYTMSCLSCTQMKPDLKTGYETEIEKRIWKHEVLAAIAAQAHQP